jgi:S-layer homology domain
MMKFWQWIPTTLATAAILGTSAAIASIPHSSQPNSIPAAQTPTTPEAAPAAAPPVESPFADIVGDVYAAEIRKAYDLGIIAGYPSDRSFRPLEPITREQVVSMIVDALPTIPLRNPNQIAGATPSLAPFSLPGGNPFLDVSISRWSASKIQYAKSLGLVSGYADGTFRPAQAVTRAELVVMLQNLNEFILDFRGWDGGEYLGSGTIVPTYSDLQNHWARETILLMSGGKSCRVASPLNERGTAFWPNSSALRNYAAAATVRAIECLNILPPQPS